MANTFSLQCPRAPYILCSDKYVTYQSISVIINTWEGQPNKIVFQIIQY